MKIENMEYNKDIEEKFLNCFLVSDYYFFDGLKFEKRIK